MCVSSYIDIVHVRVKSSLLLPVAKFLVDPNCLEFHLTSNKYIYRYSSWDFEDHWEELESKFHMEFQKPFLCLKNLCLCSQLHKSVVIFNSRLLSNYCSVAAKNFMCTFVWILLMNMSSQEAKLWVQICTSCPDSLVLILDLQFSPS